MAWTYKEWVFCNILIGFGIFLFTYLVLGLILWFADQIFYSMVAKLFNIKRCVIDVNNQIIQKNASIYTPKEKKVVAFISKLYQCCGKVVEEDPNLSNVTVKQVIANGLGSTSRSAMETGVTYVKDQTKKIFSTPIEETEGTNDPQENQSTQSDPQQEDDTRRCCWPCKVNPSQKMTGESAPNSFGDITDPDHERTILDVYGRFLTLNKKLNKFLITTISAIVISAVIIAGFQGCFLANLTVYPGSPCPYYGVMDCYHGGNATYFQCMPNGTIDFPLLGASATCFRWIGRDTSVADVMTQIGACVGLLSGLGSVVELLIRLLFFVFQQRLNVASGLRRVMEKTIGINKITQPHYFCGRKLPFHYGVLSLRLYEHPCLVIMVFIFYFSLPIFGCIAIVLLTYFRISITSLTYIILVTFAMICLLGLIWLISEEDEFDRIMPGAWDEISNVSQPFKKNLEKIAPALKGLLPQKDLDTLVNYANTLKQINIDTNTVLDELSRHTNDVLGKLADRIQGQFPLNQVEQIRQHSQAISVKMQIVKQLTGSAQSIRESQEEEKSKDVGNKASRKK